MFFKSISQLSEHIYKLLSYIFCQTDKIVQRQEINHLLRMQNFSKKLLFLSPSLPPNTYMHMYLSGGGRECFWENFAHVLNELSLRNVSFLFLNFRWDSPCICGQSACGWTKLCTASSAIMYYENLKASIIQNTLSIINGKYI